MNISNTYILIAIGALVGAIGGYCYWYFIGCTSGTCSITSIWYRSSAYGAIMGGLAMSMFFSNDKRKKEKND